jgi:hypothetical protein
MIDFKHVNTEQLLIAITDVHGSHDALDALLKRLHNTYHIFQKEHTLREGVTLHFNGDYIDRGPKGPQVLDLVKQLDDANQSVTVIPGNHDLMMVFGATQLKNYKQKYPSLDEKAYVSWYNDNTVHGTNYGRFFIKQCGGVDSFIRTYAKDETLGKYLLTRSLYAIHTIGTKRILCTHADLPEEFDDLEALQQVQSEYIAGLPKYLSNTLINDDYDEWELGAFSLATERVEDPLWEIPKKNKILRNIGVDFHCIGHTPQTTVFQFGTSIYFDVGMYARPHASALLITPDAYFCHDSVPKNVIDVSPNENGTSHFDS